MVLSNGPHWNFDEQGCKFSRNIFTSDLVSLDSVHEEVLDLRGISLLRKHELLEA